MSYQVGKPLKTTGPTSPYLTYVRAVDMFLSGYCLFEATHRLPLSEMCSFEGRVEGPEDCTHLIGFRNRL